MLSKFLDRSFRQEFSCHCSRWIEGLLFRAIFACAKLRSRRDSWRGLFARVRWCYECRWMLRWARCLHRFSLPRFVAATTEQQTADMLCKVVYVQKHIGLLFAWAHLRHRSCSYGLCVCESHSIMKWKEICIHLCAIDQNLTRNDPLSIERFGLNRNLARFISSLVDSMMLSLLKSHMIRLFCSWKERGSFCLGVHMQASSALWVSLTIWCSSFRQFTKSIVYHFASWLSSCVQFIFWWILRSVFDN